MNQVVFKASAALSPTRGIHSGNCGFSRIQQKGRKKNSDTNKAWIHAQYHQSSTSFWKNLPMYLARRGFEADPPNRRQQGGKGSDRVRPRPHDSATGNPKTTARLSIQRRAVARMPWTVNEKLSREEEPALFRGGGINRIPIKRCTIWNMRRRLSAAR